MEFYYGENPLKAKLKNNYEWDCISKEIKWNEKDSCKKFTVNTIIIWF